MGNTNYLIKLVADMVVPTNHEDGVDRVLINLLVHRL